MDQIPAGRIGNMHAFTGIAHRTCFMDLGEKGIELFIKENFFPGQLNMDFRTDQALVMYAEKFGIILWCINVMEDAGIIYIQIIDRFSAVFYSALKPRFTLII